MKISTFESDLKSWESPCSRIVCANCMGPWWFIDTISHISLQSYPCLWFSSVFAMYLCLNYIFLSTSCGVNPPSAEISVNSGIEVSNLPCLTVWTKKNKNKWSLFFAFFEFSRSFILSGNHAKETGEGTDSGDTNSWAGGMGAVKLGPLSYHWYCLQGIRWCYNAQSP